jgi:hypothetical protein
MMGDVHVEVLEELRAAKRSKARIDFGMECATANKHQCPNHDEQTGELLMG